MYRKSLDKAADVLTGVATVAILAHLAAAWYSQRLSEERQRRHDRIYARVQQLSSKDRIRYYVDASEIY